MLGPPACHAHFPAGEYRFLRLFDETGTYGYAALAERDASLELHLEVVRWGPQACRAMRRDVAWLRRHARQCGVQRIVGIRQEPDGQPDPRWDKFTKHYGFSGQCVFQAAFLEV